MKKNLLFFTCCLTICTLSSCSPEPHYVMFYNYDGTVLYKAAYKKGMELEYYGEEPTKPMDDMYTYSFSGWNHPLDDVDASQNYYAQFSKELRKFKVSFRNYNRAFISDCTVEYGKSALPYAPAPSRDYSLSSDGEIKTNYVFSKWEGGDPSYITADTILTASFDEAYSYRVTFLDNDGTTLHTEYIEEGEDSSYTLTLTSYKDAPGGKLYVFDGWSESVIDVHSPMTVYAQYKAVAAYTVTFLNYDGTVLATVKVPEGGTAMYPYSDPTRPSYQSGNYTYSYTFTGWDGSLTNVKESRSVTARYSSSSTYYNATYSNAIKKFKNYCSSLDSDGVYKGSIYSGLNGSMYEQMWACYDQSDNVCYLYFYMSQQTTSTPSSVTTYVYLPNSQPGNYNVYYIYRYGSNSSTNTSFSGSTSISSSFSSYSSVSFYSYSNPGGTSISSNESTCASMINKVLTKASAKTFFDASALGFNNY